MVRLNHTVPVQASKRRFFLSYSAPAYKYLFLFIYLFIYLFICTFIYLFIYLFMYTLHILIVFLTMFYDIFVELLYDPCLVRIYLCIFIQLAAQISKTLLVSIPRNAMYIIDCVMAPLDSLATRLI